MTAVKAIEALLPQTQCGECGYAGCLPYAEALAQGVVSIDRCPPGGVETVRALAKLLAINPELYLDKAKENTRAPALAIIREAECIGCTKCIQACPVDAIIGSAKQMHAILDQECTGCGLCVEPCPVDCIELQAIPEVQYDKQRAKQRFQARQLRLLREQQEQEAAYREKRQLAAKTVDALKETKAKQAYVLEAMSRVKAKKNDE